MRIRHASVVAVLSVGAVFAGCDTKPPRDFLKENIDRINGELARWGGSWEAWEKLVSPYHEDVRKALASRPEQIPGIVGRDGFLFFRRSLEVLVSGDLRDQEDGRDPFPAVVDFYNQLKARGVDLLFCPIPVKGAVLTHELSERAPAADGPYVDLYTRKLLLELAEAGVECVDLLPHFIAAKDEPADEAFYMPLDTHWSNRALRICARVFAERIRAYPWYREAAKTPVDYTTKETECTRGGDIRAMLPEAERLKYRPMKLGAERVLNPDGSFYEDDKSSPIIFLGDSYASVFHFEDCQHAGISAHIAKEIGVPVDLILGQGMGPKVRAKLARRGKGALDGKKLVIWALSERDLYNYRAPWDVIPIP